MEGAGAKERVPCPSIQALGPCEDWSATASTVFLAKTRRRASTVFDCFARTRSAGVAETMATSCFREVSIHLEGPSLAWTCSRAARLWLRRSRMPWPPGSGGASRAREFESWDMRSEERDPPLPETTGPAPYPCPWREKPPAPFPSVSAWPVTAGDKDAFRACSSCQPSGVGGIGASVALSDGRGGGGREP